jgi:hypothetical protein
MLINNSKCLFEGTPIKLYYEVNFFKYISNLKKSFENYEEKEIISISKMEKSTAQTFNYDYANF